MHTKGNDFSFEGYNTAFSRDVGVVSSVLTTQDHSLAKTSAPNSVMIKYDKNGNKLSERYYDKNGRAYLDIDYTDHGNRTSHPIVPHQHTISWENGKFKRDVGKEINK